MDIAEKESTKGLENETLNGVCENGNIDKKDEKYKGIKKRETWTRRIDFLLACVGYSVGFGNVWRFPYLCYKNGGGAFLIPYFISVAVGGIPLFYLEVAFGQFMGVSGVKAWRICPLFEGLGIASNITVFLTNCYYNVIICWAFYFAFSSFTTELPWKSCGNWWNTDRCHDFQFNVGNSQLNQTLLNLTHSPGSVNTSGVTIANITEQDIQNLVDPVTEFWERKVLGISDGIEDIGGPKWDLTLCLLFSWIVVYICICKGIKSSGKVLYVTATVPFVFMAALLIRNFLLEGSINGVVYYLKPDLSKLGNIQVWADAGTQIFWSYSIGIGALIALGSYNTFNHNSYRDVVLFSLVNTGTSIFAGFLIFTILGHMAYQQNISIEEVAASGPGLAFIAYPKAVSLMPVAPMWSALFFLMLILLGIDSQFVAMEGFITAIVDYWPHILRRGYRREIFIALVCCVSYLIGLPMVTKGGMYVFQLFDYYANSRSMMLVTCLECMVIAWIYGANRFYDNIEMMLGKRINKYMWVCWVCLTPIFCVALIIVSTITYAELDYKRNNVIYVYPGWAVSLGWCLALCSIMTIPAVMIYKIIVNGLSIESLKSLLKPKGLLEHQLRDVDKKLHLQEELEKVILS